jgi:CRISPR-associated protein Cas1
MTDLMIDLSESAMKLSSRGELLVLRRAETISTGTDEEPSIEGVKYEIPKGARVHSETPDANPEKTVPFADIAAVVAAHPHISISKNAITGLARAGAALVVCDEKFMPAAMMLPLHAHHAQTERFAIQAEAPLPLKKRLWQQIVEAKTRAQGSLLAELRGSDAGILAMSRRVRSGDPDNIEAQAARAYWPALFCDPDFRRDRYGGGPNALLNYGYAVLRGVTARAVAAAGLHPSLGLHHHNKYDAFCLASDMMEPFRCMVDRAAAIYCDDNGAPDPLDRDAKAAMLGALSGRLAFGGERRTLFDALSRSAASLAAVFEGKRKSLALPEAEEMEKQGDD